MFCGVKRFFFLLNQQFLFSEWLFSTTGVATKTTNQELKFPISKVRTTFYRSIFTYFNYYYSAFYPPQLKKKRGKKKDQAQCCIYSSSNSLYSQKQFEVETNGQQFEVETNGLNFGNHYFPRVYFQKFILSEFHQRFLLWSILYKIAVNALQQAGGMSSDCLSNLCEQLYNNNNNY